MNSTPPFSVYQLPARLSRITVRYGHTRAPYRPKRPELTKFEPGHGEQIWVFCHWMSRQIVYSHKPVIDSNKALKQLPFNGKKTKPAKMRRDYWEPMAMIQFPQGQGMVGVSAFQKLREFRRLHELSYPKEMLALAKTERGKALNNQKANSVADMAAVLAGTGRGNLISREAADDGGADRPSKVEATVYWADERDRHFARQWSGNVTHETGLPLEAGKDGSAGMAETVDGEEGSQPQTSAAVAA